MTLLATVPPTFEMASIETYTISFDMANALGAGEVISTSTGTVQASLFDEGNGGLYPAGLVSGSISVSTASIISATVTGLLAGHNYRLLMGGQISTAKRPAAMLYITCRF